MIMSIGSAANLRAIFDGCMITVTRMSSNHMITSTANLLELKLYDIQFIRAVRLRFFVYFKAIIHLDVTVDLFSDWSELEFAFDCDATHLTSAGGICERGLEDSP